MYFLENSKQQIQIFLFQNFEIYVHFGKFTVITTTTWFKIYF